MKNILSYILVGIIFLLSLLCVNLKKEIEVCEASFDPFQTDALLIFSEDANICKGEKQQLEKELREYKIKCGCVSDDQVIKDFLAFLHKMH